ncbi:MAG TPA: DegT/DnrJ/EryC1/StrS family aminotransferase [Nitrososphaeraceae archaeon]|nr:DegT/DnrJ/EryC1/StrS family aminotransferase [Nitrososphaeraceae archaeon]
MIPINRPWLSDEEKKEILKVLDEGVLTSPALEGGKRVREFESLLRSYLNIKHVIAVNSGTSALLAALLALGLKEGDEVLLPSFTFVASANSVVAAGGTPVFVDINKADYTIDIKDLATKITDRTRAIMPVHLYGHPADLDEIFEIAKSDSIQIVEDACQSLGSEYRKRQTGTIGSMGCFSMYASKVLTSGEGGAIVTDDDQLADRLRMIRNHGMVEGYDTRVFGLNLRLPELSAAIAKGQMKKLSEMLEKRRNNANLLTDLLSHPNIDGFTTPTEPEDGHKKFNWYLYTVTLDGRQSETKNIGSDLSDYADARDLIKDEMANTAKIGVAVYYDPPVHLTPYYKELVRSRLPDQNREKPNNLKTTEWASKHVLSLPVHPLLSTQDIEYIANSFKSAKENIRK